MPPINNFHQATSMKKRKRYSENYFLDAVLELISSFFLIQLAAKMKKIISREKNKLKLGQDLSTTRPKLKLSDDMEIKKRDIPERLQMRTKQ